MEFKPKTFSKVYVNSYEPNLCSPLEQKPEWLGIIIEAPEEIIFSVNEKMIYLPICGYYRLDINSLRTSQPIKLSVNYIGDDKVFSGFLIESDTSPTVPQPKSTEVTEEESEGMALGEYFNPDLLNYVEFPLIPGEIQVFVEYGGMKSNTVTIKIQIN